MVKKRELFCSPNLKARRLAQQLKNGKCGLRDGSKAGEWRLPTIDEWKEMVDTRYERPALSNAAGTGKWTEGNVFLGVKSSWYWSSSGAHRLSTDYAWDVNLSCSHGLSSLTTDRAYVWLFRGGH